MERERQLVLVVEDQKVNREILRHILQPEYDVIEAENGEKALSLLKQTSGISAVLLDIVMPVMDGYAFLRAMNGPQLLSLPVIAVTATKDAAAEQKALDLGAWDFISKPYEPKVLMTRLKNVIIRSQFYLMNKMKHVYEHDPLTDLYERSHFFTQTRKLLDKYPDQKFSLLRFDIDNFHLLNSFWGEEEGNRFLRFIADGIRRVAQLTSPSVYGRISADTFCMCIPYDFEFIRKYAELVRGELAGYNRNYLIKPSIGIYIIDDPSQKIEIMYEWATLAALECKNKYETCISFYKPELSWNVVQEQSIVHEMQEALDTEQFLVYFQPKYNLETEQPYGAEALIRWRHPEKGLISPGVFIPVFERNGFIGKIDRYMWEKVCQLLRKWSDEGKNPAPISVNVSRVNMYNPNLVGVLTKLVQKYGIDPRLLSLELTESAYMDDPELMKKTVISLQNAGFTVMMDDFGSGYSSLNTLKNIPFNMLKIDMNFLSAEPSEGRDECILASVIRMAGWLGLPVIMEGVETPEQVSFLKSIGCGYVQGYYFAKPMPVSDYEALLASTMQHSVKSKSENHDILFQALWTNSAQMDLFFRNLKRPAAAYEFEGGSFHALRVNTEFSKIFGYGTISADNTEKMRELLLKEDFEQVSAAFQGAAETGEESDCSFSVPSLNNGRKIQMKLQYWGKNEKSAILFALFSVPSEQLPRGNLS